MKSSRKRRRRRRRAAFEELQDEMYEGFSYQTVVRIGCVNSSIIVSVWNN